MRISIALVSCLAFLCVTTARAESKSGYGPSVSRTLASEDADADLANWHAMGRRLGVSIGMAIPMGDFAGNFGTAPMIGIHYLWGAIKPVALSLQMKYWGSPFTTGIGSGKLSVAALSVGAQMNLMDNKRFVPYAGLAGGFYFNNVSFSAARLVSAGNDSLLTTVGVAASLGFDYVVGRELSVGLVASYHYCIPKSLSTSTGTNFNLGSPFTTVEFRVDF